MLAGTVIVNGTDDEWWPESDEHVNRVFSVQMILDEDQPAQQIEVPDVRWGGECRVEVALKARVVGKGTIQVDGEARFYEGVSESSSELADSKTVSITVPKGGIPAHHSINLRNTEVGGGDYAKVGLSFTNSLRETPD